MKRPPLNLLDRRCQKPGHPRIGTWLARHVGRPAALRITWVVLPCGVTAHQATLTAWALGCLAAACLCWGTPVAWLLGVTLLWAWYLADHVDGQLARWYGPPSLDGAQLDYAMHHTLTWAVPLALGIGVARASGEFLWTAAGAAWGGAALLVSLEHDTRWKTFEQRLKRLEGTLEVIGGGGGRPEPAPPRPRSTLGLGRWLIRKLTEPHAVLLVLSVLAPVSYLLDDQRLWLPRPWLVAALAASTLSAAAVVRRNLRDEASEKAFKAWFRPRPGEVLVYRDGWWHTEPREPLSVGTDSAIASGVDRRSS